MRNYIQADKRPVKQRHFGFLLIGGEREPLGFLDSVLVSDQVRFSANAKQKKLTYPTCTDKNRHFRNVFVISLFRYQFPSKELDRESAQKGIHV